MAIFHFRLKSDKKPDGTKISAVQHGSYIRREGNFANIENWQANNKFVGNFISSSEIKDACNGLETLLYKTDDFGSIRNTAQGIEVTEKASPTTLAVALMLANETMNHKPLIISGSTNFKNKRSKEKMPEKNTSQKAESSLVNAQFPSQLLHQLAQKQSKLLPQKDFACQHCPNSLWFIQNQTQLTCFCRLMNLVSWTKKISRMVCKKIMERIDEKLDHVFASSHVEYINREKAYESRGSCIFHSHYLPKWAKDDPKKFFKAADKYEGV